MYFPSIFRYSFLFLIFFVDIFSSAIPPFPPSPLPPLFFLNRHSARSLTVEGTSASTLTCCRKAVCSFTRASSCSRLAAQPRSSGRSLQNLLGFFVMFFIRSVSKCNGHVLLVYSRHLSGFLFSLFFSIPSLLFSWKKQMNITLRCLKPPPPPLLAAQWAFEIVSLNAMLLLHCNSSPPRPGQDSAFVPNRLFLTLFLYR